MSDSEDFDQNNQELQTTFLNEDALLSVKKYLPQPNNLMDKILFNPYHPISYFPQKLQKIPQMIKADTAKIDQNNMNSIYQSAFNHNKLKKDVLGYLLGNHLPSKNVNKKYLLTLNDFYQGKNLVYQKFPSNSNFATYVLDTKAVISKQFKRKNKQSKTIQDRSINIHKIQFNSNFQSGNLFRAYQRQFNQYDLILQNDINTKGNNQWFNFSVKNVPKGMVLKFNIVNLTKKHSLFDLGMKPYVFSMSRYEKRKVGWVRQGMKVTYDQNQKIKRQNSNKSYYTLSFQYKFSFQGDIVYFSQSIPYTLTDLSNFLVPYVRNKDYSKFIKLKNIGKTLCGHQVDIFQITNQQSKLNKKIVWIIGRQHSGQVTSSYIVQGIINYLLGNSQKAIQLLKKFIFKIVPMVNIDGVVHGNTRAQIIGTDPNRKWNHPHKIRNPIIYGLKKAIEKDKHHIEMFLDLHSHSRKLGTFFYGNSLRDSKITSRKFPMMVCKSDSRFSYTSSRFSPCNLNSARHVLFQSLNIPLIYTVESSFYGYQKDDNKIIQYLPKDYRQMGVTLLQTFEKYNQTKITHKVNFTFQEDQQFQEKRIKQAEIEQDIGSDSDPSGDQYNQAQLKKILPKLFEIRKKKLNKKVVAKAKKKQVKVQKQKEQEIPEIKRPKKSLKQSHYRIYFSGRQSISQCRPLTKQTKRISAETKDIGVQASFPQNQVLKGSNTTNAITERKNLCIFGQKVEEDLFILGNIVGIQVDMNRIFTQNRIQMHQQQARKSFKMTYRNNSILQVKENNFLNRGDCGHTTGSNFLTKR